MAELKLDIVVENLNKLKKKLEGISIGGDSQGGSGNNKKGGGAFGLAVGIGAAVALLGQLVSSVDSVVSLLDIIGSLINSLVAPFVPILVSLIKPVFVLLNIFIQKFLKILGVGKDEAGDATFGKVGNKITKLLAILVGITAGIVAVAAGLKLSIAALIALIVTVFAKAFIDFGGFLGKKLSDFTNKYVVEPLSRWIANFILKLDSLFGTDFAGLLVKTFQRLKEVFSLFGDSLKKFFTGDFKGAFEAMKAAGRLFIQNFKDAWQQFSIVLKLLLNKVVNVLKNVWNGLINGLKKGINNMIAAVTNVINGIVGFANRLLPGTPFNKIRTFTPFTDVGKTKGETTINFNIQGSADQKTAMLAADLMRRELNRKGAF